MVLGVRDLPAAERAWAGLGFTLTPRGQHREYGTHNASVMLTRHYIELFGFFDVTLAPQHPLLGVLEAQGEGVCSLAWRTPDAYRLRAFDQARTDTPLPEVNEQSRHMLTADGRELEAGFALSFFPPDVQLPFFSFACQHRTPQVLWSEEFTRHPNGVAELLGITVSTPSAQLTRVHTLLEWLDLGPITGLFLDHPDGFVRVQVDDALGGPRVSGLHLGTTDLEHTAALLTPLPGVRRESDRIDVPATLTHGCPLVIEATTEGEPS